MLLKRPVLLCNRSHFLGIRLIREKLIIILLQLLQTFGLRSWHIRNNRALLWQQPFWLSFLLVACKDLLWWVISLLFPNWSSILNCIAILFNFVRLLVGLAAGEGLSLGLIFFECWRRWPEGWWSLLPKWGAKSWPNLSGWLSSSPTHHLRSRGWWSPLSVEGGLPHR